SATRKAATTALVTAEATAGTVATEPAAAPKSPAKSSRKAKTTKAAGKSSTKSGGDDDQAKRKPADLSSDPLEEELAAEIEDVVVEETEELTQAAEADAAEAASDTDFEWDDEESEALKQARRDAELTASADSVRAYLKQIGKVPL